MKIYQFKKAIAIKQQAVRLLLIYLALMRCRTLFKILSVSVRRAGAHETFS